MKATFMVAVGLLAMGVAPALAEDGHVPQASLSAVGLGGMQFVSDADGLQVRGMSGRNHKSAWVSGRSIVVGQVVDPKTNSFVLATDTNGYYSQSKYGIRARTSFVYGDLGIGKRRHTSYSGYFFGAAGPRAGL